MDTCRGVLWVLKSRKRTERMERKWARSVDNFRFGRGGGGMYMTTNDSENGKRWSKAERDEEQRSNE